MNGIEQDKETKNMDTEDLYGKGNPEEGEIKEPFNPKEVDIIHQTMVIANIIERLKEGRIILEPNFQRRSNLWDDTKQSRLIESLIVRIPLPSFYFDFDDENDNYIVVDGLQRLWTIRRFTAIEREDPDRLRLTGLEYLPEYNDCLYEDLPALFQRRIREQNIIAYVIRPGTPENVRNSIFTRINTGGLQLTPAEIKNSVYRGQAASLLRELAHSNSFKLATNNKVSPSRMLDCELVNRFLAFYILDIDKYQDNLELYLNEVLKKIKKTSADELDTYRTHFYQAMDTAYMLMEKNAFRRMLTNGKYSSKLNKPLFECTSVCFAELSTENCKKLLHRKEIFLDKYEKLLKNPDFLKAITSSTARKASIIRRNTEMKRIIFETITDPD